MITYIKLDVQGFYVDFPEEIDPIYWEGMIGETLNDFYDGKWVKLSDEQVAFHENNPEATIQQVWDMNIPVYTRTLEDAKEEKMQAIDDYDNSSFVNGFDVISSNNIITAWLTPVERANYRSSIDAAELVGLTELSLYIGEISITLPIATAKLMLAQIQLYADQCFIVTKQHKVAIETMNSIEDVDNYDITQYYPTKLTFNVD